MSNEEPESYVYAYCFPDNAYADVQLSGAQYAIDRDSVQNQLCRFCVDSINDLWLTDKPPAEFAIISFEDRTIQGSGKIDLMIHYLANRFNEI